MTLKEKLRINILKMLGLVNRSESGTGTKPDVDRETLINDSEAAKLNRLKEYNIWYYGDEEELLNFYTYNNLVDYNYEPYYARNKRSYFWSISSTETDIKRTHSGQPRNIVDTITNIMRFPLIDCRNKISEELRNTDESNEDQLNEGMGQVKRVKIEYNPVNDVLQKIIKESGLEKTYKHKQIPLTLVEGWGCYKINWDKNISDYPYAVYYRAENVDFVYRGNKLVGCIFRDYYTDGENRTYLLVETRSLKYDEVENCRNLVIEKELFRTNDKAGDYSLVKENFSAVPELSDIESYIEIGPLDYLFAEPSIFFENSQDVGMYGRSIFTGKIGLFDDLDQCLSQAANAVRRSTVHEYFNVDFLERDRETGMPKQPKSFDRKYTMYMGATNADGTSGSNEPVQVTQPNVDFAQYSEHAKEILMQIINGVMSPATLGIDISKKDNAEAQREKEKVTIFTRNAIIDIEAQILKSLCNQLLCAYEFMTKGKITVHDYDISVKFSEFADDSFENKLEKLSAAYNSTTISDEMFMRKLYGDTLSRAEFERELEWLKKHHTEPKDEGMQGIAGGGDNLEGMFDNMNEEDGFGTFE